MPKPFANTQGFNGTFYDTYLIAMQAGTATGDPGLDQMRKISLGQLRAYVRQGFGNMMNFRGAYSSALPENPEINDYFYAAETFTADEETYTQYHFYEYNGTAWFDISGVLSQYCTLAQVQEQILAAVRGICGPDLPVYDPVNGTYQLGDAVVTEIGLCINTTSIVVPEPFDPSKWLPVNLDSLWNDSITTSSRISSLWTEIGKIQGDTTEYRNTATYAKGDFCIYDGTIYRANQAISTPESWTASHWDQVDLQTLKTGVDTNADAITSLETRVFTIEETLMGENEITVNYPDDGNYPSLMPNRVPLRALKFAEVPTFSGKSRAWNQLVENGNFASGDGWVLESGVTASFSGNVATISSTTSSNGIRREIDFINGHKYLVSAEINTESALDVKFGSSSSGGAQVQITTSVFNQFVKYSEIKTASANTYQFYIFVSSTYSNLKVRNVTLYDLSLIFGAGNEPSTVADALALLPALGQYNAYDAGSLVSTEVSGVKSVGVNIWDEEWEVGRYDSSTGQKSASTTNIRNKNFIKVSTNTSYYLKASAVATVLYYDANMNFISLTYAQNEAITTPSNACYINFFLASGYGTTYNHDVQICLNSYADKTTYHPYKTDTLSLSEPVTLRSAGSVADEHDVESGVTMRNIGVELVTEERGFTANGQCYQSNIKISGADNSEYWGGAGPIISPKIPRATMKDMYEGTVTNGISMNGGRIIIGKDTYANRATLLDGTTLFFALATPTTESIDPITDNFLEVEGGGTVETIQTQTPIIDNCLDVGYLTV